MRKLLLTLLLFIYTTACASAADVKISALPAEGAAARTDEIPVNNAGTTKKVTVAQLFGAMLAADLTAIGGVTNSGTPTVNQIGQWVTATTMKGITLIPTANGGLNLDLSAVTGGKTIFFDSAGVATARLIAAGDLPTHTHPGTDINNGAGSSFVPLSAGGTNANLSATGGAGFVLKQDSVGAAITVGAVAGGSFNPLDTTLWWFRDDFDSVPDACSSAQNCFGWTPTVTNSGVTATANNKLAGTHPGVWSFNTGVLATGTSSISRSLYSHILGNGALDTLGSIYADNLSVVTDEYIARWGMMDTAQLAPTNGVWLEYDRLSSVNWRYCARKASSATPCTNSTTAVTAAAFHKCEITCNAGATSCTYIVDGTTLGSLTTNIPNTVETGPVYSIIKSAGTTARAIEIDYWFHQVTLTTAR